MFLTWSSMMFCAKPQSSSDMFLCVCRFVFSVIMYSLVNCQMFNTSISPLAYGRREDVTVWGDVARWEGRLGVSEGWES